ncbi:MAG: dihydrofolate reductase [Rikenellaceae bacterium]|nr:dihydrofolate reductase [Rikenellaceae bacterium]
MVSIIVAIAQNGIIGSDNRLIWHISEDLKRFKAITSGHPVIMGRKTYESLGRPLPNRLNVVISRNPDYSGEGITVTDSLEKAIGLFPADQEIFVIGGAEVYRQALPLADRLYLTEVCADYTGDTAFPSWNRQEWELISQERYDKGEKFEHPFCFLNFIHKK